MRVCAVGGLVLAWPAAGSAQQAQSTAQPDIHEHVAVTATLLTPTRETTGTSWLPQATPMYGVHRPWRGWDVRLNGMLSLQTSYEPGERHRTGGADDRQVSSVNWGMLGIRRNLAGGRFGIRTMVSAEPWTVPGCGVLSFLATGEVCDGDTVHDRQPVHDLLMELSADYERPIRGQWRWQLYAGLAGEPALGPPGFTHRASAMGNPLGPITHHWLDSTHVAFGVVTGGISRQRWKVEASVFNGREPDESRVDLDFGAFDSAAARISFLPTERLALQVSAGRLREAMTDFVQPAERPVATRFTASAAYHVPLQANGIWATTLAYGANHARESASGRVLDAMTHAALLESSATFANRHTVFGRGEVGGMPAHHLHATEYFTDVLSIGKIQFGYVRHLPAAKGLVPGIGGTFALSLLPAKLAPRYEGRAAPSVGIFFSLQAARHQM
jgi:hypothetical protein